MWRNGRSRRDAWDDRAVPYSCVGWSRVSEDSLGTISLYVFPRISIHRGPSKSILLGLGMLMEQSLRIAGYGASAPNGDRYGSKMTGAEPSSL